ASLVDNPCMYGATFELIRAAGAAPELCKFKGSAEKMIREEDGKYVVYDHTGTKKLGTHDTKAKAEAQLATIETHKIAPREDVKPGEGVDEYGHVEFADPKNKKYPIDSAEHIRAAWSYIHHPKNADMYSAEDRKTIEDNIVRAWKKHIDPA